MNQTEQNKKLAQSFSKVKYCSYNHNYPTISVARKFLDILYSNAGNYGTQSAKCNFFFSLMGFTLYKAEEPLQGI